MKIKYLFNWINSLPSIVVIGLFLYSFVGSNLHIATPIFILIIYLVFIIFFIHHNAYLVEPNLKNMKKKLEQYIIKKNYTYNKIDKAVGELDIFIEEEYEKYRNDTVAKLAPSVFPILGIFFTFASIALFMPDFTSKNADSLNGEITGLLQGVGTAFYASMYGLGMLLWWQFFEQKGMNNIEQKILEVKKEYINKFWTSHDLELIKLEQQSGLENSLKSSIQSALSPEFINQLNNQLTSQLSNLSKIISTETDIHKNLLNQFDKFTTFQTQLMSKQELLVESYDSILINNKNIVEEQHNNLAQIGKVNSTIYENLASLFSKFDNSADKLDLFSTKSELLVESFDILKNRLDETTYNFDSVVALTDNLEQLTNKIEETNENYNNIITMTSNTFKEIVEQNNEIKELFGDKIDLINNNSNSLLEHSKSLNNIIEKIDLEGFTTNMKMANDGLTELKGSFINAVNDLNSSVENVAVNSKELANQSKTANEMFDGKIDLINNNSNSLVEHSKSLNNIIEKIDLEGFTTNMKDTNNQIEEIRKSFSTTSLELKDSINLFNDNIVDKIKEVFKTIDIENAEVLDRLLGGFRDIQKQTSKFEDSIDSLNTEFTLFNEQLLKILEKDNS